jgi:hypothetical protein
MTAIGQGLYTAGIRPSKPTRTWFLLSPEGHFAACRELMIKYPGLSFLSPEIYELRASGIESAQLLKVFHFVEYFGKERNHLRGLKRKKRAGRCIERFVCYCTPRRKLVKRSLLKIQCVIPSIKSMHENLKYLEAGATLLKELVIGRDNTADNPSTLYRTLREHWTEP